MVTDNLPEDMNFYPKVFQMQPREDFPTGLMTKILLGSRTRLHPRSKSCHPDDLAMYRRTC